MEVVANDDHTLTFYSAIEEPAVSQNRADLRSKEKPLPNTYVRISNSPVPPNAMLNSLDESSPELEIVDDASPLF